VNHLQGVQIYLKEENQMTNNLLLNKGEDKIMNKKKKKGFTLIELIVVIAILGILAAIAVPRLTGFRNSAQKSALEATLRTIDSASTIHQTEKGTIAADVPALVTAGYMQSTPVTTGVTFSIDSTTARAKAAIAANTFGTHAAIAAKNVDELKADTTWSAIK
jgi:type IV pilus assembly protein PilA